MVGMTTTGNVQTDWLPEASVAVQVTIVVPRGKKLPDGGTHTTDGAGSQMSVAVTEKNAKSPWSPPFASTTDTIEGQ